MNAGSYALNKGGIIGNSSSMYQLMQAYFYLMHSPLARTGDPSRAKTGMALVPAGRPVSLSDLRRRGALVLVVDGDAVVAVDAGKQDRAEVYDRGRESAMKRQLRSPLPPGGSAQKLQLPW